MIQCLNPNDLVWPCSSSSSSTAGEPRHEFRAQDLRGWPPVFVFFRGTTESSVVPSREHIVSFPNLILQETLLLNNSRTLEVTITSLSFLGFYFEIHFFRFVLSFCGSLFYSYSKFESFVGQFQFSMIFIFGFRYIHGNAIGFVFIRIYNGNE